MQVKASSMSFYDRCDIYIGYHRLSKPLRVVKNCCEIVFNLLRLKKRILCLNYDTDTFPWEFLQAL